ncbi:hypothetical protein GALMADRAFT_241578 [Galerina marginata CBS 339.88]|uniref:Protein ARV n=1 Tax=Galerina marginata (strain CBS 339.88) TaxID=685588 RepID=A0A067TF79_GALM3|nr:hypothetical protein GALMADRAFT_241578 [Galerina marginata CBS 339.88]
MPICTTCTHPTAYLYTVYESEYNLRLEQCQAAECNEFVDPYVEHDSLTILLDLFLLKRGVYRHLLYNRGAAPRRLTGRKATPTSSDLKAPNDAEDDKHLNKSNVEIDRWLLVLQLGVALIFVDAFIRWSHLNAKEPTVETPWTKQTLLAFLRVFLGTTAETIAFHGGITLTCYIVMKFIDSFQRIFRASTPRSSIRQQFHLSLISLSLFYSSLTKLFLLFLLTIWLPTPTSTSATPQASNPLPGWAELLARNESNHLISALGILDDDKLDREWIVRNVLGGMSAGFGLRVILDIHPLFTTVVILAGWAAKTTVATLVSKWVGQDELAREAWLAYSIP